MLCLIGIAEIGFIISVAVILFGCTAVFQNPFLQPGKKILWLITIIVLNWIGLLWYYYTFYYKNQE